MASFRSGLSVLALLLAVLSIAHPALAKKAKQRRQPLHASGEGATKEPQLWTYSVVAEYPHDPAAFTQGLQFDRTCDNDSKVCFDVFWESTGLNGKSSIRQVDVNSGKPRLMRNLDSAHFGEGSTRLGDTVYMLTWRTGKSFKFSVPDLAKVEEFDSGLGDGWGLTTDGTHLIASESSEVIHFLDPATMKEVRRITVKDRGHSIRWLNELEVIDGELWGNVWQTECIARVNLTTGEVNGWVFMHGLREGVINRGLASPGMDVLNGIAYDPETKRIFVTGKQWPRVFEIVPKPYEQGKAPNMQAVSHQCWPRGWV